MIDSCIGKVIIDRPVIRSHHLVRNNPSYFDEVESCYQSYQEARPASTPICSAYHSCAHPRYVGKLATHDVLKTTHLTKTAPIFTFSQLCNSVLSNGAYFAFLLPCNSVLVQRRLDYKLLGVNSLSFKGSINQGCQNRHKATDFQGR